MNNYELTLTEYVKKAKLEMNAGLYEKAYNSLLGAAKCALLLAKQSVGVAQNKYLEQYRSISTLIKAVEQKMASSSKAKEPEIPTIKNDIPSAPVNNNFAPSAPASNNFGNGSSNAYGGASEGHKRADVNGKNLSLSPKWLSEYVGQPQAVTAVKDLITAARLKNSAMPHIILYGSHGLGKTTFSKIIANEMGVGFTEINVSKITAPEMIAILKKIQPKEIVFIDEIHTLPLVVAESILYSAMQDGRITYTEGKGKFAKTCVYDLPPFTLIGATTEIGKLAKPFIHRAIQVRLEEYSDEVLATIISKSFYKLGMSISGENSLTISKRCRSNPRTANNLVKRISDKALVRYATMNNLKATGSLDSAEAVRKLGIEISAKVIDEFFVENGIDKYGLESGDRELLKMIIERYGGGPVGIDTLARAMNESNNVIAQKYEAYLIKKAMIKIEREGRVAMPEAYRALGLPVPKKLLEEETADQAPAQKEEEKSTKYDRRKTVASHVPDENKCRKLEELITYPDNCITFTDNLDTIFFDVEKPYEAETKHSCELEIDFGEFNRLVVCDSFLESRFADCMASVGFIKDIKAQTLEIPYISQQLANRRYFPDFAIRDFKDRIAIIEMKNFDMMSYHLNIDKYERLKAFCEERGYGYAEIAKPYGAETYVSFDMLKNAPVNEQLEKYISDKIEENGERTGTGVFTEEDLKEYEKTFGKVDKCELFTILLNNRQLKNVDRVGNNLMIEKN